ncbi:MAG TPA: ArsA family ATPase, partial [Blastocatellia bacterium]
MKREGDKRRIRKASARAHSSPANQSTKYLFFGGKGGVGKTTAAAAAALYLLDHAQGDEQILLFSTDPAHSLSDSLETEIGDQIVEIEHRGKARLFAREMDAARALARFKEKHGAVMSLIAERGTLLDESDISDLLNLSLPGLDEVMALFELSELERAGAYTRIVVDTAPSGHTSRLLELPDVFAGWVRALNQMEDKHRFMVARLMGRRRVDEVDIFLREMNERIERVRAMIYDGNQSSFTLVTIPEIMVVEETLRYFDNLRGEGVPVTSLLVNRVEREHNDCKYCRARTIAQKPLHKRIAREFESLRIHRVPLLASEVRGLERLRRFAHLAWEAGEDADDTERATSRRAIKRASIAQSKSKAGALDEGFELAPRRLLIFGGKGGVGKTTAAAGAAIALAHNERARVLIFSTDPAHSLSDSFDERVGELKTKVARQKNLDASEIDPLARFEAMKDRYRAWTDELFESLTAGSRWEIQFDREAMREIISLAPPGIDEIAALGAISDQLDEGRYTTIVLDTAPTGHLVRFLELPEIALSWVRTFMKLLLKYKNVADWSGIAEELVALSKSIKRLSSLMIDPRQCEFVGVAIPERM